MCYYFIYNHCAHYSNAAGQFLLCDLQHTPVHSVVCVHSITTPTIQKPLNCFSLENGLKFFFVLYKSALPIELHLMLGQEHHESRKMLASTNIAAHFQCLQSNNQSQGQLEAGSKRKGHFLCY